MNAFMIYKPLFLCDTEMYYSDNLQNFVHSSICHEDKQWIYNLQSSDDEKIILNHDDFVMVKDKYSTKNQKFLLVFLNKNLKTIRDLRHNHLETLKFIQREVPAKCASLTGKHSWKLFFHYFPSVFQLHLHVHYSKIYKQCERAQHLNTVIKNLEQNSMYYKNAIIMTQLPKAFKNVDDARIKILSGFAPEKSSFETTRLKKRTCSLELIHKKFSHAPRLLCIAVKHHVLFNWRYMTTLQNVIRACFKDGKRV